MPAATTPLARFALFAVLIIGLFGVAFMGVRTYQDAPPIPDYVDAQGHVVVARESILEGQVVFQRYALMNYGSMFGDGAGRGPDFTADALHTMAVAMRSHHQALGASQIEATGLAQQEIKRNRFDPVRNTVTLTPSQLSGHQAVVAHYTALFKGGAGLSFKPSGYITRPDEIRALSAFFFWGAWVCGAERPGQTSSYTHNWPFDELAGNRPSPAVTFWSVAGIFALIVGVGLVLYVRGRLGEGAGFEGDAPASRMLTVEGVSGFRPTPAQRGTYKFFVAAACLFGLQVLAGVLTVHDFLGFTQFFGVDVARLIPITVARSWHLQWGLMWIITCWIASSIFVLPMLTGSEPAGQARLVNGLFGLIVVMVVGSAIGIFMGPMGLLGPWWHLLGNQGWEFVELGKLWQVALFVVLALWCLVIFRGLGPAWRRWDPSQLHSWLGYTILAVLVLFLAGFVATPRTNFVIADFWRWCVVHMWVEAFLEVFTTIIVGAFMVLMGLASRQSAARVVMLSALLFLGSGILGISHNFYWNAKPEETLALGGVFSTLQVVPLVILALEAWKTRQLAGGRAFGQSGAFLFLLGVNFWNFYGAGVLGLIINLPFINYYEHGTYLTVNHGHAAFMGVYGNLSLAAMLFCARFLIPVERWSEGLVRGAFWSLNLGLMLMVMLDLFPVGILQFQATLEHGLWYSRSLEFVDSATFQRLTWLRAIGGYVFTFGGVVPLFWLIVSRWRRPRHVEAVVVVPQAIDA